MEPKQKINIEQSKATILKKVIKYVVTSLNYQNSLLALCLLSILKDISKEATSSESYELFARIIKEGIEGSQLTSILDQQECAEDLR